MNFGVRDIFICFLRMKVGEEFFRGVESKSESENFYSLESDSEWKSFICLKSESESESEIISSTPQLWCIPQYFYLFYNNFVSIILKTEAMNIQYHDKLINLLQYFITNSASVKIKLVLIFGNVPDEKRQ